MGGMGMGMWPAEVLLLHNDDFAARRPSLTVELQTICCGSGPGGSQRDQPAGTVH